MQERLLSSREKLGSRSPSVEVAKLIAVYI
jgi:hypothetical protein